MDSAARAPSAGRSLFVGGRSLFVGGAALAALLPGGLGCAPAAAPPARPARVAADAGPSAANDAIAAAAPAVGTTDPEGESFGTRNIIRKKLPQNLTSIALEYTVILVDENGREQAVDPAEHVFQVGDEFLVRIKPQDDVYVYVFNEGPGGDRVCLVPAQEEEPRLVRKGEELSLPEGDFLQFAEPAGEEKLLVVAVAEPTNDVRLLARNAFAAQKGNLRSREAAGADAAEAARKALTERTSVRTRGTIAKKSIERLDTPVGAKERITHVEPPRNGEKSTYGIAINGAEAGAPELVLDIPLRSKDASPTGSR